MWTARTSGLSLRATNIDRTYTAIALRERTLAGEAVDAGVGGWAALGPAGGEVPSPCGVASQLRAVRRRAEVVGELAGDGAGEDRGVGPALGARCEALHIGRAVV